MRNFQRYLFNAYYQWMVDSEYVPYLVVNATAEGVEVPREHVSPLGQITLNLSPASVVEFSVTDTGVQFLTRFGGVSRKIRVPFSAMYMLMAKGQTHAFDLKEEFEKAVLCEMVPQPKKEELQAVEDKPRPALRVVK